MRTALVIAALLAIPLPALADEVATSLAGCLPTTSRTTYDPDRCSLTYRPPPPLKQDVEIGDCSFLPGWVRGGEATLMACDVFNGSREAIESMNYGVRYMENGRKTPLLEAGFQGPIIFGTASIPGDLQPGESRVLMLAGPGLPTGSDPARVIPVIEILDVRVQGSLAPR